VNEVFSKLLGDIAIFGGITEETKLFLLNEASLINMPSRTFFFHENDIAEDMYILVSGIVEVVKIKGDTEYPIAVLHKGECFGEMAVVDHYPRSASVIALEDCSALKLDIQCFDKIYHHDIKQFAMLQMNIGREICRRLRDANELLFKHEIENKTAQVISLKSL